MVVNDEPSDLGDRGGWVYVSSTVWHGTEHATVDIVLSKRIRNNWLEDDATAGSSRHALGPGHLSVVVQGNPCCIAIRQAHRPFTRSSWNGTVYGPWWREPQAISYSFPSCSLADNHSARLRRAAMMGRSIDDDRVFIRDPPAGAPPLTDT
jgi:hypothetical protein